MSALRPVIRSAAAVALLQRREMCGLVAISTRATCPLLGDRIRAALKVTRHRGPDEQGEFVHADWGVGLGHARLSITDVAGGQQPMRSADGTVTAIVNGEFYDHERIRSELEARGKVFSSRSDSEILVHLWEEKGPACLDDLRGEFALVLVDDKSRQLFAARDRFGVKPLFVARPEGELLLASEVKALFAAGVPAAWNSGAVFDSLHGCRLEGQVSRAMPLPRRWPGRCHAAATLLPRRCHAAATPLPRR